MGREVGKGFLGGVAVRIKNKKIRETMVREPGKNERELFIVFDCGHNPLPTEIATPSALAEWSRNDNKGRPVRFCILR